MKGIGEDNIEMDLKAVIYTGRSKVSCAPDCYSTETRKNS
jgi:hypothetical protein